MSKQERALLRRFVDTWRRAGPELEAIRRHELSHFDFAANWKAIDDLLAAGLRHARTRTDSGMVEMQQWFLKLAQKQGLVPTVAREAPAKYGTPSTKTTARKKKPRSSPSRRG